ncbi:unnamed protein product [Mytilus edulis]|uniref:Uncharacterized protein n=1 Tax=Mytilus edulis TaxID=6550 RepID=A0A8S3U4B4_MYTED|nr:unnamed protein product [Mytilus edulis]
MVFNKTGTWYYACLCYFRRLDLPSFSLLDSSFFPYVWYENLGVKNIFSRNQETRNLRRKNGFLLWAINGPSEAPARTVVRIILVRLGNFLNLEKNYTISSEKSNSKDNPAEGPHASENLALSKQGPLKSAEIFPHKNAKPGTPKHLENRELMAEQVTSISCLEFSKNLAIISFYCFRGVKDNFIFDDEDDL